MLTTADDISFVLSGGTANINPNKSLGGDPSSTPIISDSLNNLFDDVSPEQSISGTEDYRCIYVFNDGDTTVWSMSLWAESLTGGGASIELGIESNNETQRLTIIGAVGGTLTLQFQNRQFTTNYNPNTAVWAAQLQTVLRNLTVSDQSTEKIFRQVSVSAQNIGSNTIIFDIIWSGKDSKRNFDKIQAVVDSNNLDIGNLLLPIGQTSVGISVVRQGSPVNTIANEINVETVAPGGVSFVATNELAPIVLPRVSPGDGFPIWIKRTVPANITATANDNFTLKMSAQSLEPS